MQIHAWCLTESGEVHHTTVPEKKWEYYEKNGYKRNPLHLPNAIDRLVDQVINAKSLEKNSVERKQDKLDAQGDIENADKLQEEIAKIEREIEELSDSRSLEQQELNSVAGAIEDAVEVENFLLNLKSMKSKKKIVTFLYERGFQQTEGMSMKVLKEYARKSLRA